jgi:hypothetical protein
VSRLCSSRPCSSKKCPTSCLVATGWLGAVIGWACPAVAAKDDPSLGQEYIDMPPAPPEAEAAKPPEPPREDENPAAGYVPGYRRSTSVGLSPLSPEYSSALPGALAPSFGAPQEDKAWRFDFHGYMQGGMRAGIGTRSNALEGQHKLTLHGDPAVAGASYGWFDHSNTVPGPWAQLNFIYGNETVQATAILGAWSVSESMQSAGFFQAPAEQGVVNAFLTYTPDVSPIGLKLLVGTYQDRYGAMDKYSEGAYGVSLIGSVYGVGTTATVELPFEGDWTLRAEAGFKGQMTRPPMGIVPDGSNENARPWEGSTYAAHAHLGASYEDISPTLHYIRSFSQDDLPDPIDHPGVRKDATLEILGADVRWDGERFGYFYFGAQRTRATNTKTLGRLVTVLNGGDGNEFMQRFWGYGSNGTGTLFLTGGQYTLSLGTLLRYPTEFWGDAPDLIVSLFGIYGHVTSPVSLFDDKDMIKSGTELTYSFLPWMAVAGRADYVIPDMTNGSKSFGILSPKLIFRSDWKTRESLTIQYARYLLGDEVVVKGDNRLLNIPSGKPDRHLVSVFATMWW